MLLGKIRAWVDSFLEKWPSKESQWSSPLANQKQGPWMLLFSTRGATSGFLSWLPVTCSWIVSSVFRHNTGISYVYQQHWRTEFLRLILFFKASWSLFSLQFISVAKLCLTLCDLMDCSTPGFPVHHQLPELAQTHVHRVGDAVQPSHSQSSPFPPAFNLSQHQGLSQGVSLPIRWPKYWSFSISASNEYSGLISFRTDWFDLLAVWSPSWEKTLKSLLQHHSSKA